MSTRRLSDGKPNHTSRLKVTSLLNPGGRLRSTCPDRSKDSCEPIQSRGAINLPHAPYLLPRGRDTVCRRDTAQGPVTQATAAASWRKRAGIPSAQAASASIVSG